MKKKIFYILVVTMLIITSISCLSACNNKIEVDEGISILKDACKNTIKLNTYYSRIVDGNTEWSLNYWGNTSKDSNDLRLKYMKTESTALSTTYTTKFYGSSLPASVKKEKNAKKEDYKVFAFYDKKIGDKVEFVKEEMSEEEFYFQNEDVDSVRAKNIILSICNLIDDENFKCLDKTNTEFISITKVGKVVEYIVKIKENVSYGNKNLYELCQEKGDNVGLSIRVTDNVVSKIAVVKLNNKNEIDKNEVTIFAYYISKSGPNLTYFGQECMPHYDEVKSV